MNKSPANQREGDCCHSNDQIIHKTTAILFFFHYLSLFLCRQYALFQLASLSTTNTMFTTTKPLGYNKIMCFGFFLGETDKKKLKITSLQWLQASERTEMFIGRCQNYRRKKSNNAKIIVCWCRANEAEAQPKPKPTPKPILLNIV